MPLRIARKISPSGQPCNGPAVVRLIETYDPNGIGKSLSRSTPSHFAILRLAYHARNASQPSNTAAATMTNQIRIFPDRSVSFGVEGVSCQHHARDQVARRLAFQAVDFQAHPGFCPLLQRSNRAWGIRLVKFDHVCPVFTIWPTPRSNDWHSSGCCSVRSSSAIKSKSSCLIRSACVADPVCSYSCLSLIRASTRAGK